MWDLKPSDAKRLITVLESEASLNAYFESLMKDGLRECEEPVTLIDDYWVYGMLHREALNKLSIMQIEALDNLDTNTARSFMNGYRGLDWNNGIML